MAAGRIQPSQDPKTDATERVPPREFTWRATALMAETGSGIQWRAMLCHGRKRDPAPNGGPCFVMAAGRIQPSQQPKTNATERVPPREFTWRATALMAASASGTRWIPPDRTRGTRTVRQNNKTNFLTMKNFS